MTPPEEPVFSVVIPCRDDQDGLDEAVASVLAQSVDQIEVLVVDDGSEPPVRVPEDPRVRLIRREVAAGPAVARNAGLDAARGRYVAFCDSDDVMLPGRLALALELHRDGPLVVVRQRWMDLPVPRARRRPRNPVQASVPHLGATTILRSECPRLDDRYVACEDIEWWIRVTESGLRPVYSPTVGYSMRRSKRVRILNSSSARLEFSYQLLAEHARLYDNDRRARAFRWLRIAILERRGGNPDLARTALARSVRAWPLRGAVNELRHQISMPPKSTPIATLADARLPPLSPARGRCLQPGECGTAESRISRDDVDPYRVRTAWGEWVASGARRVAGRYVDPVLLTAVFARLITPGMTVIDEAPDDGWWVLVATARVGASGRVGVVAEEAQLEAMRRMVERNGWSDRLHVHVRRPPGASVEPPLELDADVIRSPTPATLGQLARDPLPVLVLDGAARGGSAQGRDALSSSPDLTARYAWHTVDPELGGLSESPVGVALRSPLDVVAIDRNSASEVLSRIQIPGPLTGR